MGMTLDKAIEMLIAKEQCMERETSGINSNCNFRYCDNCDLCYEQGTMGEQKEVLKYAAEIMSKYQKVEEAYKKYQNDVVTNIYADKKFVKALEGIFEDGNND